MFQEEMPPEDRDANPPVEGHYQIGTGGWTKAAFDFDENTSFVGQVGFGDKIDTRLMNLIVVHESVLSDEALEVANEDVGKLEDLSVSVDDHDVDDRYARLRVTVDGVSNRDVVREKERFVGLPDNVEVIVDAVEAVDGTKIPCGCGDYSVEVPERNAPEAIDVVCPECGNHFGHDKPAEDEPGADE